MLLPDNSNYLLSVISCLCLLLTGAHTDNCSQTVLAQRTTFTVPAGGSLSLSCLVQHCGDTWTGNWMWKNSRNQDLKMSWAVEESVRHRLTRLVRSSNETQLILSFQNVNQSDEGFYGCRVVWGQGVMEQGHWMYVNITAAIPCQRSVLHRVSVFAAAFLCLPIILGLARCLSCLSHPRTRAAAYREPSHPAPQPPSRCPVPQESSTSSHKAPCMTSSQQRTEVVYADISQGALRQQGAIREPAHSTVYSSLRFS